MRPHAAHASSRLILLPTLARSGPKADADVLPSCLLLAVLLHVWLALMVGDRISPDALGQRGWGSLTVTLLGPSGSLPGDDAPVSAQNWRDDGPIGQAKSPRYGGQLRREAPPPESGPGAEKLGRWKQQEVKPDPSRSEQDLPEASSPGAQDLPPKPQIPEPQAAPPLPATPPQPSPETTVLSLPQESAPRLRRQEAVQSIKPPAAANPALRTLPELPNIAPAAEPSPVPATEPTLRTLDAPPTQRPSTRLEPLSAARPPGASARLTPVPPSALPSELPTPPEPLPAAKPEPVPLAPPNPVPLPAPAPERASPAPPVPSPAAASPPEPAPAQAPAPKSATPSTTPSATPSTTPNPPTSSAPTRPTPSAAPVTRGDPLANPLLSPRGSPGAPDAGARVGHDVATPPSASASAPPPPLNLSLPRSGVSAARRGPGMLELLPGLPERKTKMEKAVEEANRDDCRTAHSEAGLLAAVPLAIDSARGKGCKW